MTEEYYTVTQVANMLKLSSRTIYRAIKSNNIPYVKIGRLYRFRSIDIENYIADK